MYEIKQQEQINEIEDNIIKEHKDEEQIKAREIKYETEKELKKKIFNKQKEKNESEFNDKVYNLEKLLSINTMKQNTLKENYEAFKKAKFVFRNKIESKKNVLIKSTKNLNLETIDRHFDGDVINKVNGLINIANNIIEGNNKEKKEEMFEQKIVPEINESIKWKELKKIFQMVKENLEKSFKQKKENKRENMKI
eukprot:GAHX01002563.1.p2 GENE.GAHX01002563.1~~GAHX01002563.1.p2  ORF type:complete len:195 (+),score=75.35 GAHX01002563.1:935-1519(+)